MTTATAIQVPSDHALRLDPGRYLNVGGGTVYYKGDPGVSASANDGSVADGASVVFGTPKFVVSSATSRLLFSEVPPNLGAIRGSKSVTSFGPYTLGPDDEVLNFDLSETTAGATQNTVQLISIDATSGTFKVTFLGQQTSNIAFDADYAAFETAMLALSNIGPGDLADVSSTPGSLQFEFTGQYAGTLVGEVTCDSTGLAGNTATATPSTAQPGGTILSLLIPHNDDVPIPINANFEVWVSSMGGVQTGLTIGWGEGVELYGQAEWHDGPDEIDVGSFGSMIPDRNMMIRLRKYDVNRWVWERVDILDLDD